jgi:GT2 family glycosyltransferase
VPRFSVVVPAYNAAATLAETLNALSAQVFADWECVVVDDGSTDETASIVQAYAERDLRFRLVQQENLGCAGAYRAGIAAAASGLLVICSADDYLLPGHLAAMDAFVLANPDYEIYSSNGQTLEQASGRRGIYHRAQEWQGERSLSLEDVIAECFYSVGAVFRDQIIEMTGGYRLVAYVEDYDLWLRAMAQGARHLYTPQVLSVHRVSDSQKSADVARVLAADIEVYENLLCEVNLPVGQQDLIRRRIAICRAEIDDQPIQAVLGRQAQRLESGFERLFGARGATVAMRLVHPIAWLVRPARRLLARLRAR